MSQRFSYVKYDEVSAITQQAFKEAFQSLESMATMLPDNRAKSLFLTALEVAYMWVGKSIRDEQIARNSGPSLISEISSK